MLNSCKFECLFSLEFLQKPTLCPAVCRFGVLMSILFDLYREIKLYALSKDCVCVSHSHLLGRQELW